jgi:predicted dehydrogenase
MLAGDDVDLVSLCSPRREDQLGDILRCLKAETHCLAEKPCVLTVEDLDCLEEAVEESPAHFREMAGSGQGRVISAFRRLVDEGRLGTVVHAFAQKSYPYHDRRPQDRGIDGGIIRQAGIHGVRFMHRGTGLRARRVTGFDTTHGNPQDGELQMSASVALELDSGALGTLHCNYCNPPNMDFWGNDQFRLHGTNGMAEAVDGFTRCRVVLNDEGEVPLEEIMSEEEPRDFFDQYVEFLLEGTPMRTTLEDDLQCTRTVDRAQQAVDEDRPLVI